MKVIHFQAGHVIPIELHVRVGEEILKLFSQEVQGGEQALDRRNWHGLLRSIFWPGPTSATVANFQQRSPVSKTISLMDLPLFHSCRVHNAIS